MDGIEILGNQFVVLYGNPESLLDKGNHLEDSCGVDQSLLQEGVVFSQRDLCTTEQKIFNDITANLLGYFHRRTPFLYIPGSAGLLYKTDAIRRHFLAGIKILHE